MSKFLATDFWRMLLLFPWCEFDSVTPFGTGREGMVHYCSTDEDG